MNQTFRRAVLFVLLVSILAVPSSALAKRHRRSSEESGKTEQVRAYKTKKGKRVKAYKRHPSGSAPHHKKKR